MNDAEYFSLIGPAEDTPKALFRTNREQYKHEFIDAYDAWITAKRAEMLSAAVDRAWIVYVEARERWLNTI